MGLPPRAFGERAPEVEVRQVGPARWAATIDGRPLPRIFPSERDARAATDAERLRLDALGWALLRRVRRGLRRKQ